MKKNLITLLLVVDLVVSTALIVVQFVRISDLRAYVGITEEQNYLLRQIIASEMRSEQKAQPLPQPPKEKY